MAACKPWMTYTHPLWCENHFWWPKTGRKHLDLVGLSENGWKMVNKWKMGINLLGQSAEWYKIKPLYRCFQRANFDTPQHGHHEFCMQFWPTRTDSHAVSHFKELWCKLKVWMFVTYPDIWGFLGLVLRCIQGKSQTIHSEIEKKEKT